MREDVVRLAVVGTLIRRRWRLLVIVAVLGALLGAAASLVVSPGYASTSRVLLQGEWDKTDLATQVLIATSTSVLDRVADTTGAAANGTDLRDSVTAALGDGKVIEITATARTPELAQRLGDRATQEYVIFGAKLTETAQAARQQVVDSRRERLTADLEQRRQRIAELEKPPPSTPPDVLARAGADLERVRSEAIRLEAELQGQDSNSSLEQAKAAMRTLNVVILEPAPLPEHAAAPSMTHLAIGGAALFFLLGILGSLTAARRDPRLRHQSEIESALGSRQLGSVEVADPSAADWRARARRLILDDQPWDAPVVPVRPEGPGPDVRYRRVIERLPRDGHDRLRLLVLLHEHDDAARQAAAWLAVAAADGTEPVVVVTDSVGFAGALREVDPVNEDTPGLVTVLSGDEPLDGQPRTVLWVVETTAARPVVPDGPDVAGALVVLTSGTRTGWELARLTEACADALVEVLGVLVAHLARPPKRRPRTPVAGAPDSDPTDPDPTGDGPVGTDPTDPDPTGDGPVGTGPPDGNASNDPNAPEVVSA